MPETTEVVHLILMLVSLLVATLTLTILALLFKYVKETLDFKHSATSGIVPATSAAAIVAQKKASAEAKKPGRSCGHCGTRIKGDPTRGIAIDEKSYMVYTCPDCGKETLIAQ